VLLGASAGVDRITHTEYATEVQKYLEQYNEATGGTVGWLMDGRIRIMEAPLSADPM